MSGPVNPDVEEAVIGALFATPDRIGEVIGAGLEPAHFHLGAYRLLFDTLVNSFYDGDPVDPLTIGERHAKQLARMWGMDDEKDAVTRVGAIASKSRSGDVVDHAKLVKRDSDYRDLHKIIDAARKGIEDETYEPEQVAGIISQEATKVATNTLISHELVSFADSGRQFVRDTKQAMAAKAAGVEMGAHFGIPAIDRFTRGLQAGELLMGAGEPGVGKSAVWWRASLGFAERQAKRPADKRIGTMILSLEMDQKPSNVRFASMLSGIDSANMREGNVEQADLDAITREWAQRQDLPLWMSYAPALRASQLRAIISEGVRRHNIGLVVIDHFKYFHLDKRATNRHDEEGDKAEFLKEQICKDLGVAVVCLAHTRKPDATSNGRPRLADLRGSGDISAHADFVSFIFRPWLYASAAERDNGKVDETTAEMIWAKNRHGLGGTGNFTFDPKRMFIF